MTISQYLLTSHPPGTLAQTVNVIPTHVAYLKGTGFDFPWRRCPTVCFAIPVVNDVTIKVSFLSS